MDECLADGCTNHAQTGTGCDDGEPCTADDLCVAGTCEGGEWTCGPCAGEPDGTSCDDENAATVADLCIDSKCAGFTVHQGAITGAQQEPGLTEVRWTSGGFHVAGSDYELANSGDVDVVERGWIARLSNTGLEVVEASVRESETYTQLAHSLAVTDGGHTLLHDGTEWTEDNWLQEAFDDIEDVESISAAFGRNTANGGLYFLSGRDEGQSWILRCASGAGTCVLDSVSYEDFPDVEIPRKMAGWTNPSTGGSTSTELVLIADFPTGSPLTPYYNDAVARPGTGPNGSWSLDYFDSTFASSSSRDVSGTSSKNAWWVGSAGLLRGRSPQSGTWLELTSAVDGQSQTDFNGVFAGESSVLFVGDHNGGGGKTELRLVVHRVGEDLAAAASYSAFELMSVEDTCAGVICPAVEPGGSIQDIWRDGETIVAVGWILVDSKRTTLVFVRNP